jgi:serine/threonine-protein kinase
VIYPEIKEPFNAAAKGTPLTSCPFAEQVRRTAQAEHFSARSPSAQLKVVSPVSRKWYEMQCTSAGSYATCTGGEDAVVYLYNTQ